MKGSALFLASILPLLASVTASATKYTQACMIGIDNYQLPCTEEDDYYGCRCISDIYIPSVVNCLYEYNLTETKVKKELKLASTYCTLYGTSPATVDQLYDLYEKNKDRIIPVSQLENASAVLTNPIIIPAEYLPIQLRTVKAFYSNLSYGEIYG